MRQLRFSFSLLLGLMCSSAFPQDALRGPANVRQPESQKQIPREPAAANARSRRQLISPRREPAAAEDASRSKSQPFSMWRVLGVLTFIAAGIIGAVKAMKHLGPFGAMKPLPDSACQVLGMTTLPNRHTLYALKVGQRILLVGSAGEHLSTLTEFTEPHEVASFTNLCRAEDPTDSESPSFFSRLLSQSFSSANRDASHESSARQELEARLNTFANS